MKIGTISLTGEAATVALARALAPLMRQGDALLLHGDLGAGKTCFARALIQALPLADGSLSDEPVPSPTFTIQQVYERACGPVFHYDLYRIGDPDELIELGFYEQLPEGLSLVEWPDRLGRQLPACRMELTLEHHGEGRQARLEATGLPDDRTDRLKQAFCTAGKS